MQGLTPLAIIAAKSCERSACKTSLFGPLRYSWWSPQPSVEGSWDDGTGPNALYYGTGNTTYLTGLGKIYLERLGPEAASSA